MTVKALIEVVDQFLGPAGFDRKGMLWNRRHDSIVEAVDIQISNAGDAATINVGVLHDDVYAVVWGGAPQGFVEEPFCVVRARVGQIVDGHDLWWPVSNEQTPQNIVAALAANVLPFLDESRTEEAMEAFLDRESVTSPLQTIYLAILRYRRGDVADACATLKQVRNKARGDWSNRAAEVATRLGCEAGEANRR